MSEFKVTLEKIKEIKPHGNADRLEIAELDGKLFQFVVQKGLYSAGDYVLYFPVDSLLPTSLQAKLGVEGKLSGAAKNRIKTIRLRGEYSQGMVAPADAVFPTGLKRDGLFDSFNTLDGYDYAELLGVTKYEPPLSGNAGRAVTLPLGVVVYDIESVQNRVRQWESMIDGSCEIIVTEKLEGTHFSYSVIIDPETEDVEVAVSSRRQRLSREFDSEGKALPNKYLDAAERFGVSEIMSKLVQLTESIKKSLPERSIHNPSKVIYILRGELIGPGIQGNIYNLKENKLLFFDFEYNNVSLPEILYFSGPNSTIPDYVAPVLAFLGLGETNDIDPVSYADGKSVLADVLREGVVYQEFKDGGRQLKVRSLKYLSESEL